MNVERFTAIAAPPPAAALHSACAQEVAIEFASANPDDRHHGECGHASADEVVAFLEDFRKQ